MAATLAALLFGPWLKPVAAVTLVPNPDNYSVIHDRVLVVPPPGVLANDVGLLGKTAVLVSGPSHGTLNLRSDGGFTYTPVNGYVGTDLFRYRPSGLLAIPTNVTITITNATPSAANDSYSATTGVTLVVAAPGVLANDHDADGDGLTATPVDRSGNGSLSLSANGGFTFKSGGSFTGTRTFTYRATDGIASSAISTVSIVVTAPTPTPTPRPTPLPTPPPTPPPTPAPTPTPTPILPPPSLPLPSLPLPSVSIPPLPFPTPTPTPTPAPGATGSPGASSTPTPTPASSVTATSSPTASTDPSSSPGPAVVPSAAGGPSAAPGFGGGVTTNPDDGFTVGRDGLGPIDGLVDVNVVGFDGLIEWAVPALVLSVPGLLLLLAVLAQAAGGLLWLPVVRRWLGGFGFRKRRTANAEAR